ncbi:hypothetical protein NIES4075_35310 [Tolypothrix sp. NIES-4075]|uniref:KGK domain-containing protein n=1 Tax=Tolypothrix sp. NIES-4075 TaxID=2005459 RepID=UPI000B5CB073|nr:KGK domain-containing protein [Tolypothrix sp. NIES-4075]GAX42530.1 hypothetical protein NIES4075_35310 [Tolypothrix sp. NIES-4075]
MVNGFEALSQDDVVSIYPEVFQQLNVSNTFKAVHLLESIKVYIGSKTIEASLFNKGINCEVLRLGNKRWQKGKVRIRLEFSPDERESPLEELRQQLKQIEHQ